MRINMVIKRVDPLNIGPEPGSSGQIQGQVHAQTTVPWNGVHEMLKRRSARQAEVVSFHTMDSRGNESINQLRDLGSLETSTVAHGPCQHCRLVLIDPDQDPVGTRLQQSNLCLTNQRSTMLFHMPQ